MNRKHATQVLTQHLDEFEAYGYDRLAGMVGHVETREEPNPDGRPFQIEIQVFWDAKEGGTIRVLGSVDTGGWRAFAPLSDDRLVEL